ncbi:MAG: hypothetical protein Q7U66_00510 [Methylobacter sp.]|nr:hypothetical protein [Methylobacter sp.]
MTQKQEETNRSKAALCDWHKREGELAASALTDVLNEQTGRQRKAYASEWERHERLLEILVSSSPAARKLVETIGAMKVFDVGVEKLSGVGKSDFVLNHQMDIMSNSLTDRLSFRGKPFDARWTEFRPFNRWGTAARGPSAQLDGTMSLDLTETYVDRPIAYGGWMRNAAGVGTWFKPKSKSTYVRVAPFCDYGFRWKDDSSLQVAHNSGDIGVFIQRFLGPGQFETVLDDRTELWRDGTSWYQTHQDEQSGYFTKSNYFWASSSDWYLVWVWCNSAIDFATKTTFGSSRAYNNLLAHLRWLVFEQWA